VIRYTPLRPFVLRMNDRGGAVEDLLPKPADESASDEAASDAAVGGGSGGAPVGPETPGADGAAPAASLSPDGHHESADTRG
jgi:hypothetical protein